MASPPLRRLGRIMVAAMRSQIGRTHPWHFAAAVTVLGGVTLPKPYVYVLRGRYDAVSILPSGSVRGQMAL